VFACALPTTTTATSTIQDFKEVFCCQKPSNEACKKWIQFEIVIKVFSFVFPLQQHQQQQQSFRIKVNFFIEIYLLLISVFIAIDSINFTNLK